MSLLRSRLASVYLVLDWHRSRREEKKNPLSRYLFSTHVASIGRDLAGYNRQRNYYWLRLSGTCGNDIPFSGSDFRAPKTARHAVTCVGRAFSIWRRLKRSHLDEKAVKRVLDTRSRYTAIIVYASSTRETKILTTSKYLTQECLKSINAECRADSPGMLSIVSYQIDIDDLLNSEAAVCVLCGKLCSSPWSLPVYRGSAAGKARAFDRCA
ncbi:hypothetical protein ALC56_00111 [Trachymyrmex septentrionalis]|uniref:Uncharacterized protein n=1 Tax=Trachymyrmex septentrionalis TaxID=34720 RepID=A0A195FYN8_9HYME|nr:hypothetical protein ALC56_00111 [Trachymyrmex septentrionalis]